MNNYNDEIWAVENVGGTATIITGKTGPETGKKVSGNPETIKAMAERIANRNDGSLNFSSLDDARGAITTEETIRLAGL